MSTNQKCFSCDGTGTKWVTCPVCRLSTDSSGLLASSDIENCGCHSGQVPEYCATCAGTGSNDPEIINAGRCRHGLDTPKRSFVLVHSALLAGVLYLLFALSNSGGLPPVQELAPGSDLLPSLSDATSQSHG